MHVACGRGALLVVFEHNQNWPKRCLASVRKPSRYDDVVDAPTGKVGRFGNGFEGHPATFPAPICGIDRRRRSSRTISDALIGGCCVCIGDPQAIQ